MSKDEQLLIRLTSAEKAELKLMAQRENTTMAKLVKSRVFGLDDPGIQKDFQKELSEVNKKLFLLLQNTKDGNEQHTKIIELVALMISGEEKGPPENKTSIFDYLVEHIQEVYIREFDNKIENQLYDQEKIKFQYAREQFQNMIMMLEDMRGKAYPDA